MGTFSCLFSAAQTPIFTITSGTYHVIKSGTVVSMDGLVLTPSKDFSLSGKSLTHKTTASNTATNPNISNYYAFNGATNAFTGVAKFNYSDSELNGLNEAALKLNIFISSTWVLQPTGTFSTTDNYVQNTLSAISMKELTLGYAACVKPTAPSLSVTQPTCTLPTGTVKVTSSKTGLLFSIDGINYNSSTGVFSGLASGTYSVTAKNSGGCISAARIATVNAKPVSTAVFASNSNQSIYSGTAILAVVLSDLNNATGTTYSWSRTNTTKVTGIATSGTVATISGTLVNTTTTVQTTVFTITAKRTNGCSSTKTVTIAVYPKGSVIPAAFTATVADTTTATAKAAFVPMVITKPESLQVYPNPTHGAFNLVINNFGYGKAVIKISDASGRQILVKEVQIGSANQVVPMQINNAVQGLYYIRVVQPGHQQTMVIKKE